MSRVFYRVRFKAYQDPGPSGLLGKIVVVPEGPEELAELDGFRVHVGRTRRGQFKNPGDSFEIAFYPKRQRQDGQAAAAPAVPELGGGSRA